MATVFIQFIWIAIIQACLARSYSSSRSRSRSGGSASSSSSGSTGSLSTGGIIGIACAATFVYVILMIILVYFRVKRIRRQRKANLPIAVQMALAQEENQYKPPGFNQAQPYNQTSRHSAFNYQKDPTKLIPVS
ncbi:hypothetical protein I4U23_027259 [Adineta vaga]|nr:hypothetical protein I4U23_027259 [Adineta vaga]